MCCIGSYILLCNMCSMSLMYSTRQIQYSPHRPLPPIINIVIIIIIVVLCSHSYYRITIIVTINLFDLIHPLGACGCKRCAFTYA